MYTGITLLYIGLHNM